MWAANQQRYREVVIGSLLFLALSLTGFLLVWIVSSVWLSL
jgi:hypothetical protein